jgi:tRNA(fMet)-specific endonuclease VapC
LRQRLEAVGDADISLCSVVLAELYYGAAKSISPPKTLAGQAVFVSRFRSLPFDDAAARSYGPIRADLERSGTMIGANDLLIAAIAMANGLVLVTHNLGEFRRIPGLRVEDWEAT